MEKLITNGGALLAALIIGVALVRVNVAQGTSNNVTTNSSVALGTELSSVDLGDATGYIAVSQAPPSRSMWGVKVAGLFGRTIYALYNHATPCDQSGLIGEFETDSAGAALAASASTEMIETNHVQICQDGNLILYGNLGRVDNIGRDIVQFYRP